MPISLNTVIEFLSTGTGVKIENLTWINDVDNHSPYSSGYKDSLWNVSTNLITNQLCSIFMKTTPSILTLWSTPRK